MLLAIALLFGAGAVALLLLGRGYWIAVLLVVAMYYGWVLLTHLHYREGRRNELLDLLATAAEAGMPLPQALRAYLEDRPHGTLRELWVAILLFFVVPGYYWICYWGRSFDRRVAHLAELLEQGVPLPRALRVSAALATRDTLLAAVVGESTGKLAKCLRTSIQQRHSTIWLELLPRLVYPAALVLFITGVLSFLMLYIIPKFEKIFKDFDMKLPDLTVSIMAIGRGLALYSSLLPFALLALAGLAFGVLFNSTLCWYLPGLGWFYRMQARGRVLKLLGLLLEAGLTVPRALAELADSGQFSNTVARRLERSRRLVEAGDSLAPSLNLSGLLPGHMVPLVESAERMHNLPWALAELGDHLASRSVRVMQRISLLTTPVLVFLVGLLVGSIAIGMFVPLIKLLEGLTQ
jgi:type II secretory pathway component PulF